MQYIKEVPLSVLFCTTDVGSGQEFVTWKKNAGAVVSGCLAVSSVGWPVEKCVCVC